MNLGSLLIFIAIGAVAGWLAGVLVKGAGYGLIGNIAVGVVGAFVGGFVFQIVGLSTGSGLFGAVVTAVIGAVILLAIVGLVARRSA